MVRQVRTRHGARGPTATKPVGDTTSLDGETVILRKTDHGYVLEPTSPRLIGTTIPGYFIPTLPDDRQGVRRVLTKKATKVPGRHVEAGPATPVLMRRRPPMRPSGAIHAPEPMSTGDLRDREVRRWKEIREGFLREHRSITAPELAELTGSRSRNPSSRAHEWMRAGRIFAVHDGSCARYPLFQIDESEGRPRPEIQEAVAHLRERLSGWHIALWFTTANAWTGDWRRPVDLLGREPERVVDAARHEVMEQVL